MKRYYVPPIMRAIEIDTQGLIAQSTGGTLSNMPNSSAFGKGNNQFNNFNNQDAFDSGNGLGDFKNYSAW